MSTARSPRTIDFLSGGPDKTATELNNALYVIVEFVSQKRLSTLARRPRPAELIAAVDTYMTLERDLEALERARALRLAAELWREQDDVPESVFTGARALMAALIPEPPEGWIEHDGYSKTGSRTEHVLGSGATQAHEASAAETDVDPEKFKEASARAAAIAQTLMHGINLVALLASPKVLARAVEMPTQSHVLEHLDGMASALGATTGPGNRESAQVALSRLRIECAGWTPSSSAPVSLMAAARDFLSSIGFGGPPEGWDAFEGVTSDDGTERVNNGGTCDPRLPEEGEIER